MGDFIMKTSRKGGSGRGCSFYTTAALCPKRALLDKTVEEERGPSTLRMDIGTIFHDYAELYHTGNKTRALQYEDMPNEEAMCEAQRVFSWYTSNFPVDAWGDVHSAEVQLPRNEEEAKRIKELVGVEFTMRADLATTVTPAHAAKISARSKCQVPEGNLLVDHKTRGRKDGDIHLLYTHSPQFQMYPIIWNLLHPEFQVTGMLANIIITHKKLDLDNSHLALFVPLLPESRHRALFDWFVNAEALFNTGFANRAACFSKGGVCPHLISGLCLQE